MSGDDPVAGKCVMEAPAPGSRTEGTGGGEDVLPPLDRAAILGAEDREIRAVDIPEWGGRLYVRVMSGRERDLLEADAQARSGSLEDFRARVAVATVCDIEGNLLFGPEDMVALSQKSSRALNRAFEVASSMNGLTEADVEELVGNSDSARSGGSGSGSPTASG